MAHQKHLDTIEGIKKTGWGKNFDQPGDAEKDLIESPQFAAWAVLSVGNQLEQIVEDFTHARMKRALGKFTSDFQATMKARIRSLETAHGEMPDNVRLWILDLGYAELGRNLWRMADGFWKMDFLSWHSRPPKGSDLRREYDAYMRRKPPKGATK